MKQRILVKQPENEEIPMEVLAEHIAKISQASSALKESRLKDHTVLLLLHDLTKLPRRDIRLVLDALPALETNYLKPKKLEQK